MSEKVVVTDEMVERFLRAVPGAVAPSFNATKLALDAALNPPAEPEIVVTQEMALAGEDVLVERRGCGMMMVNVAADVYRAMHKLAPSACSHAWTIGWGGGGADGKGRSARQCSKCGLVKHL